MKQTVLIAPLLVATMITQAGCDLFTTVDSPDELSQRWRLQDRDMNARQDMKPDQDMSDMACVPSPGVQSYCNSDLRVTQLGCRGGEIEVRDECGLRLIECAPTRCPIDSSCDEDTGRCVAQDDCDVTGCPEGYRCEDSACICEPETDQELCQKQQELSCDTTLEVRDRCGQLRDLRCNRCDELSQLCIDGTCQQRCDNEGEERGCAPGFTCKGQGDQSYCAPDLCTCKDPSDRCTVERDGCFLGGQSCPIKKLTCERTDQQCNPVTPCPADYTCQGSTCVCTGPSCAVSCNAQADCPSGTTCDADGTCKPQPLVPCIRDTQCDVMAGERCDSIRFENGFFCAVPGSKQPGQSCNYSIECAYPACESGICLAPCAKQGDCPADLTCSPHKNYFTNRNRLSCRVEPACPSCQANQVCVQGQCEDRLCAFNKDCAADGSQVCVWLDGSIGVCRDLSALPASASSCVSAEDYFSTSIGPQGQYYYITCLSDRRCETAPQCRPQEQCVPADKGKFCGRRIL